MCKSQVAKTTLISSFSFEEMDLKAQAGGYAELAHEPAQRLPGGYEGCIRGEQKL